MEQQLHDSRCSQHFVYVPELQPEVLGRLQPEAGFGRADAVPALFRLPYSAMPPAAGKPRTAACIYKKSVHDPPNDPACALTLYPMKIPRIQLFCHKSAWKYIRMRNKKALSRRFPT
ncbi:hypothetical protein D3C75_997800 [compost metagenome]